LDRAQRMDMVANGKRRPDTAEIQSAPHVIRAPRRRHITVYVPALIGGGAERVAALLGTALSAAGHQVTLVVDFEAAHNINFVDANVKRVTLAGAHGRDVMRLTDFLKQWQPDIALAIGPSSNVKLVLAHLLARLSTRVRTRVVLSYHGRSAFGTGWLGWSAYPLASLLTRYAARTICVSEDLARHLVTDWRGARNRIVRIYNPVATDRTKPAPNAKVLAARPPTVIAVGRLCAPKDFATLITAMALLPRPDARLAIYGEGPDRPALEQLAERLGMAGRIDWCGYVCDPWDAYASARCFVLSSQNESFGNVVVEALASGLPVVATECGGPVEILEGGRFGILVPIGDAVAMSAAIARVLEQPGDPVPRIARAQEFAAPTITARYVALFEDVLSA